MLNKNHLSHKHLTLDSNQLTTFITAYLYERTSYDEQWRRIYLYTVTLTSTNLYSTSLPLRENFIGRAMASNLSMLSDTNIYVEAYITNAYKNVSTNFKKT